MNYKKIYDQLIISRKERGLIKSKSDEYFEIHHIIPKCMGGSNEDENLVLLTAREHIIAHLLLAKIYPDNLKIIQSTSAILMKNKYRKFSDGKTISSSTIANLRLEYSKRIEEISREQLGKEVSLEIRSKISISNTGKVPSEETKEKLNKVRRHYTIKGPDGTIYNSIKECSKSTGIPETTLKYKLSKGKEFIILDKSGSLPRKIKGPDGTIYNSIRECARKIKKDFNTVKKWIEKYPDLGYSYIN